MSLGPRGEVPPISVVGPFFIAAPLGLVFAGVILAGSGEQVFLAANVPELVAATHAVVLGWLTLSMMGAIYQLGPATLGGRLSWPGLARVQGALHAMAVGVFVFAVGRWDTVWMSAAGIAVAISFVLFLINAVPATSWSLRGPDARRYFSVALVFLVAVGAVGVTYVGTLEHAWFPMTQGRVAGHAHLGLLGWLALMVMGASYQLVPMFQLAHSQRPRFANLALAVTAVSAAAGSAALMSDPGPTVRVAVAVAFAAGPALWLADMWRLIASRGRRAPDIQLRATTVSLGFLVAAMLLGLAAAAGDAIGPWNPARVQLAYGIAAIGGWAGTTLIGNSFKIVPFLVWYARYRTRAGVEPVPLVGELTNVHILHGVLALHLASITTLTVAALVGNLTLFHAGGALLALSGVAVFATLLSVFIRHPAPRLVPGPARGAVQ